MKQEKNKDIEARILKAAEQVFVKKGFDNAAMVDIAHEAGIGRTSLNYYFRTKEMLFEAILGDLMGKILPNVEQIVNENSSYIVKIEKIIDLYLGLIRKNEEVPLFILSELKRDPQHLISFVVRDPVRLQPLLKLRVFIENEMEKGTIRKMPLIDLFTTMISLVVFPFLIRQPLTSVFLDDKDADFEAFIDRRTCFIHRVIENLLKPETKS